MALPQLIIVIILSLAALCTAAVAVLAIIGLIRSPKDSTSPSDIPQTSRLESDGPLPPAGVPAVGKLHQQGARKSQQDSFYVSEPETIPSYGTLAVVADGMGGLSNGDKVSQAAVTAMVNGFFVTPGAPEEVLLTLLSQANEAVNQLLGPDGYSQSGTTMVTGLIRGGSLYFFSVGDSRIALYRNRVLTQLNREHIYSHELELKAINHETDFQTAYTHPKKSGLTSFLGMGSLAHLDMPASPIPLQQGDKVLLMTDGVYNALSTEELTACLNGTPEEAADLLNQAIRKKGYSNQDNYTAVILGY